MNQKACSYLHCSKCVTYMCAQRRDRQKEKDTTQTSTCTHTHKNIYTWKGGRDRKRSNTHNILTHKCLLFHTHTHTHTHTHIHTVTNPWTWVWDYFVSKLNLGHKRAASQSKWPLHQCLPSGQRTTDTKRQTDRQKAGVVRFKLELLKPWTSELCHLGIPEQHSIPTVDFCRFFPLTRYPALLICCADWS